MRLWNELLDASFALSLTYGVMASKREHDLDIEGLYHML